MKTSFAIILLFVLSQVVVIQPCAQTTAYIPSQGNDTITRILTTAETFDSVALDDKPYGAAITPDGNFLFVTRSGSNLTTRIPTNSFANIDSQNDITVGNSPRGIAAEPMGNFVYVANFDDDTISKISVSSTSIAETIAVGNGPIGVAAALNRTDDAPLVYVTNNLDNSLTVIDASDEVTATISNICNGPTGVAATPDGNYAYVACTNDDTIKVVRTSDNTAIATIDVGDAPWGVAVGFDGAYVFVTNSAADTVSLITTGDNKVIETIDVGDQPMGVAAPLNGDFAYAVNQTDNSIHKIDLSTDSITVTEIGVNHVETAVSLGAFIGDSPPAAPSDLYADGGGSHRINLTWNDNSSDEQGFKIERWKSSEQAFTQIAKVDAGETSFTDTGLQEFTTYYYRVRSYNEAADSAASSSEGTTTDLSDAGWCFIGAVVR